MTTPNVQSLERAIAILEAFSFQESEMGVQELSEKVGLTPPTVCRLIKTLERKGYLIKNSYNQKYRISLKILNFAAAIYKQLDIRNIAIDIMRKTRDTLKETIYLDVIDNEERVCVASIPGNQTLSLNVPVGQRSPFYAGADSRMLLACLDRNLVYSYIDSINPNKYASNTITKKQNFMNL
ncbi:MAG: IclR family transcriptional regulator [Firmicutes bacterium]|nr:IclR family transcriptional regulator [Bacillota bacterium]